MNPLFQLKCFCTNLEIDSKAIRDQITSPITPDISSSATDHFVNDLNERVIRIKSSLESAEEVLCGPVEKRLSQMRLSELLEKCQALFDANEHALSVLQASSANKPRLQHEVSAPAPVVPVVDEIPEKSVTAADADTRIGSSVGASNETSRNADRDVEHKAFHSPTVEKPTVSKRSTEDPLKTPTLASWKLSQATRSLFNKEEVRDTADSIDIDEEASPSSPEKDLKLSTSILLSPDLTGSKKSESSALPRKPAIPVQAQSARKKVSSLSVSTTTATTTTSTAALPAAPASPSKPPLPKFRTKSSSTTSSTAKSPAPVTPSAEDHSNCNDDNNNATPETPAVQGTPFHTTQQLSARGKKDIKPTRMAVRSSSHPISPGVSSVSTPLVDQSVVPHVDGSPQEISMDGFDWEAHNDEVGTPQQALLSPDPATTTSTAKSSKPALPASTTGVRPSSSRQTAPTSATRPRKAATPLASSPSTAALPRKPSLDSSTRIPRIQRSNSFNAALDATSPPSRRSASPSSTRSASPMGSSRKVGRKSAPSPVSASKSSQISRSGGGGGGGGGIFATDHGIQLEQITTEEWATAPSFLKMQVTADVLNMAINKLNVHLPSHDLDHFLQHSDMERIIGATKLKATLLGLVQMKRLEMKSDPMDHNKKLYSFFG